MQVRFILIFSILFCIDVTFGKGNTFGEVLVSDVISSDIEVRDGQLFWSESGESPVRKIPVNGGTATLLARKVQTPGNMVIKGREIIWIESRLGFAPSGCVGPGVLLLLNKTSLNTGKTKVLMKGDNCAGGTNDIVSDKTSVYWVNSVASPNEYTIFKVDLTYGISTPLVKTSKPIVAMARDKTHLYWMEQDDLDPGAIRRMPLGGGDVSTVFSNDKPLVQSFAISGSEVIYAELQYPIYSTAQIWKVPTSGGTPTLLANTSLIPRKISADHLNVYWIDESSLNMIPLNGGVITTLANDLDSPVDLVLSSRSVIWIETVCCALGQKGSVLKIPKTGGSVTMLAEDVDAPQRVTRSGDRVYWTEGGPMGQIEGFGRIANIPITGGLVETVVSGVSADLPPIAVDDKNVYIADRYTIKKVPVVGGNVEKLVGAYNFIADLVTDGVYVYWIETDLSVVRRIPVNSGNIETLSTAPPLGLAGRIRLDRTSVYWMVSFDTIRKVPKHGGKVSTVADGLPFISDFVVDGINVYFSEQDTPRIRKVSVYGGNIDTLLNNYCLYTSFMCAPCSLVLGKSNVFWVNQEVVGKVSKVGGRATPLASTMGQPYISNAIAIDETNIYWTDVASKTINYLNHAPNRPLPCGR